MNKTTFKYLEALKAKLQSEIDIWTPVVGKHLVRDCLKHGDSKYNWSPEARGVFEAHEADLDYYSARHVSDAIHEAVKIMRRLRKTVSEREEYNPMFRHKVDSRLWADQTMSRQFKSVSYRLNIDPDLALENQGEADYARRVTFNVPMSWHRGVYQRGLAVIKSGKGKHFVVSVKPTPMPWVEEQGMVAFKCKTIFFRRKHGEEIDGWLVLFSHGTNSDENPVVGDDGKLRLPHAFHADLRRSVSLLNSRTFRSLSDML